MADQTNHRDYFLSAEHERRVKEAIEREQARLIAIGNASGPFASISDALGSLTTHTSWLSSIGLKKVAIDILEAEAKRLKTGA